MNAAHFHNGTVHEPLEEGLIESPAVTVRGPASLSNLGPGFDTLGLCLDGPADLLTIRRTDTPGVVVRLEANNPFGDIPVDPQANTAALAAAAVLRKSNREGGLELSITKGIVPGSGIGSSAASAVAGAWAANKALGLPYEKTHLVDAVLEGEAAASGSRHGDNVLPALFGGLVLVSPVDPTVYRRIPTPTDVAVVVVQPNVQVLTKAARAILPRDVPLRDAISNASDLAFLIHAFEAGDWAEVGRRIMNDRLVEPVRAALVPCYGSVRSSAMEAGAYGCALTGSGPALFALADERKAPAVLEAMQAASQAAGIRAQGHVAHIDPVGVRKEAV